MSKLSDEAIREFVREHGENENFMRGTGRRAWYDFARQKNKKMLSDLTALISEHYTANEDVEKMVSERLREEFGLLHDWLNGGTGNYLIHPFADEYLKSEYYLKTRER